MLDYCFINKWHLKIKANSQQQRYIRNMYLYHCKNVLVTYFLFTDNLTFMFEIKMFI